MNTSKELQDAVRAYAAGNGESFTQIYELSYKYLHTCVIHIVRDEDLAMDMLQETYIEISKNILQLENTNGFLNWAATIANRKCYAYLKKQRDVLCDSDNNEDYFENIADDANLIPEELLQDREKQRLLREIIDELTDLQRLCVIGFYYNEQKQDEIAEELGIPVNTVKSHLNRAKAKIKDAVVELDVKKGTRLYSIAPFLVLLFNMEANACQAAPMSAAISAAAGVTAGTAASATAAAAGSTAGAATASATAAGTAATATGALKAAGMALKTKIALGVAGIGAVALIGTGVGVAIDKASEAKVEPAIAYNFPEVFESWDTISRNLAGEDRYLYAGGNRITMPTTIGEWEELLSTELVEIPGTHSGGVSNYTYNMVAILDKNGTEYIFNIDTESYVPIENDMEAEIRQLRNTTVVGLKISAWGKDSGENREIREYISLISEGSMFSGDIEDVNEALCEEYNVDNDDRVIEVDRFQDGYTFRWSWSEDGDRRTLEIEYVPESLLAFYQYMSGVKNTNYGSESYLDRYMGMDVECALCDVTNDGIEEMIIKHPVQRADDAYSYDILAYDWNTGSLNWLVLETTDSILLNSVMVNTRSDYADGRSIKGEDLSASRVCKKYYVYNENAQVLELVELVRTNQGNSYYINGKYVSEETYEACEGMYKDAPLVGMFDSADFKEHLKDSVGTHYVGIGNFKDRLEHGEGLKVFDDAPIAETIGEVDAWKENYIALIQEYIRGDGYLDEEGVLQNRIDSIPLEEQVKFNVKDINGDGIAELFLVANDYFYNMFLPNGDWENSRIGAFAACTVSGKEMTRGGVFQGEYKEVYSYDGENFVWNKSIYAPYDDAFGGCYGYFVQDMEGDREISKEEYDSLLSEYQGEKMIQIEKLDLTVENLEDVLDIRIYQLDGNGYKIGPKEVEAPAVTIPEEEDVPAAAASAEEAYEEFLAGERKAIVDVGYSSGVNAPLLFLEGEKISLTEMSDRVLDSCFSRYETSWEKEIDADWQREMQYAYIDCGNDDKQELAVRFYDASPKMYSGERVNICVLKYRDGQLYITYNIMSEHLNDCTLYQNGMMEWHASGALSNHHYQLEGLDRNGIRHVISGNDIDYGVFRVDDATGEWIYYDEIQNIDIYTINGMQYYTVECTEGYEYEKAVEIAEEYMKKIDAEDIPLVEQKVIDELKESLIARYIGSVDENELILWTDL